eukprot:GSChrysophyteH1.ASY1.ANO1.1468.1 assembled CDS
MSTKSLSRDFECQCLRSHAGMRYVLGVDEAGRGPLAGPVVIASCIVEARVEIDGIQDSKATTERQREEVYEKLVSTAGVYWAVSVIDTKTIDSINILQATLVGMRKKVYGMVDGNKLPDGMPCKSTTIVNGDAKVFSIAAASILAKVTRDRIMVEIDAKYPLYQFAKHKGYPVAAHRALLQQHGPCDAHRFSYTPVKQAAERRGMGTVDARALFADDEASLDAERANVGTANPEKEPRKKGRHSPGRKTKGGATAPARVKATSHPIREIHHHPGATRASRSRR